jgi:hypothetical protein
MGENGGKWWQFIFLLENELPPFSFGMGAQVVFTGSLAQ